MPRKQVKLSLNDQEYRDLVKMAKENKLALSTFVKNVIFDGASAKAVGKNTSRVHKEVGSGADDLVFLSEVLRQDQIAEASDVQMPSRVVTEVQTSSNVTLNLPSTGVNLQINITK